MSEPICPECLKELQYEGETAKQNFRRYRCRSCDTPIVLQTVKCQNWLGSGSKAASPFTARDKSGFLIQQK